MQQEDSSSSLPASIRKSALSLTQLHHEKASSFSLPYVLHPTKCRCLADSYSFFINSLLPRVLSLSSSSSSASTSSSCSPQQRVLEALCDAFLEGLCFLEDCTCREAQQQWLVEKALSIALCTDIVDVYMHDLVWFMAVFIESSNASPDACLQAKRDVYNTLTAIWSLADEKEDVESMREFFTNVEAMDEENWYLTNFISQRLSAVDPREVLPECFWVDTTRFTRTDRVFNYGRDVAVFECVWMGRKFACKEFLAPTSSDEEAVTNEAAIQARLRHSNVVHLLCCTKSLSLRPNIGLVMESMHQDLCTLISDRMKVGFDAPFSLLAAVDLMLQIAKGMQYLHGLGIVHRDLKSPNILVNSPCHANCLDRRDHVRARIADFGSSRMKRCIFLYSTKPVGTGIWRAPEVLDDDDGTKYTREVDVYSFAIVCAEILTGLSPQELLPCRMPELRKTLLEGKRPKLPISCPLALASYIEKCWDGKPSKRPTFSQICSVFRSFKAWILLGKTERMGVGFRHDIDVEKMQKEIDGSRLQHVFYCGFLKILSEMHWMKMTQGFTGQGERVPMLFYLTSEDKNRVTAMFSRKCRLQFLCEHQSSPHLMVDKCGLCVSASDSEWPSDLRERPENWYLRQWVIEVLAKHNCCTDIKIHELFGLSRVCYPDLRVAWVCDKHSSEGYLCPAWC